MILSSTSRLHSESATSIGQEEFGEQQRLGRGDAEVLEPLADAEAHREVGSGPGDRDREGPLGGNDVAKEATLLGLDHRALVASAARSGR